MGSLVVIYCEILLNSILYLSVLSLKGTIKEKDQILHLKILLILLFFRSPLKERGVKEVLEVCPQVPQATSVDSGEFLNFTKMIYYPNEANSSKQPLLLLNNEATSMRLPQSASIRL